MPEVGHGLTMMSDSVWLIQRVWGRNRIPTVSQSRFTSNIRPTSGNQKMNAKYNTQHNHRLVLVTMVVWPWNCSTCKGKQANQHNIERNRADVLLHSMNILDTRWYQNIFFCNSEGAQPKQRWFPHPLFYERLWWRLVFCFACRCARAPHHGTMK